MRALIEREHLAIDKAEKRLRQIDLSQVQDREQRKQIEREIEHLAHRRGAVGRELESRAPSRRCTRCGCSGWYLWG